MPGRGRRKAELRLSAAERAELMRAVRVGEGWPSYVLRCRIILASAEGATDMRIAQELGVSMPTVGKWRARFRDGGVDGLVDAVRPGRKSLISGEDRSRLVALAAGIPPARSATPDGSPDAGRVAGWTLDTLTQAARESGIEIGRSQVRRILEAEGVRWRRTASDDAADHVPR